MIELPGLFHSTENLREAFVDGLERMLETHHGLGVFILVLANATYDERIHARLRNPLRERFQQLATGLRSTLIDGRTPTDAPDDVLVFLKLMAVGLEQLQLTRWRRAGDYELQFNPLRAYRPPRMSDVTVTELFRAFDAGGFHFNKPFLQKEVLWQGELLGHDCRLLYNKFPFAELHGLLVIDPQDNKPQWLTEHDHHLVWDLSAALGAGMPGVGFGYNAYGAYASVNHQHLQMFAGGDDGFPVEARHWRHNGGDVDYPVGCRRIEEADEAWREIAALHRDNVSYNLLYRPGCLYLMPRRFQGGYRHASWTGGFAWSELCGAVTTFNVEDFESLDAQEIAREMAKLRF